MSGETAAEAHKADAIVVDPNAYYDAESHIAVSALGGRERQKRLRREGNPRIEFIRRGRRVLYRGSAIIAHLDALAIASRMPRRARAKSASPMSTVEAQP